MYLEEKFLEIETDSRVKGMCILNLTAFVNLLSAGFIPAFARTSQV